MTNGRRNKRAGSNLERWLAKVFRWIGFPNVITTRQGSRLRDSQKIDLMNQDESICGRLPYNVQAKNVSGHLKYGLVLSELPVIDNIINVIIHNQTKKRGEKFITTGQYAILSLEDFLILIQQRDDKRPFKKLASFIREGSGNGALPTAKSKT